MPHRIHVRMAREDETRRARRPPDGPLTGRPAVFLDRDGTLNVEVDYLADPARFELLPGSGRGGSPASEAAGTALVVVTNQSGVARGLLDEDVLADPRSDGLRRLAARGVDPRPRPPLPHHPTEGSGALRAGLLLPQAAARHAPGGSRTAEPRPRCDPGASAIQPAGPRSRSGWPSEPVGLLVRTGEGARPSPCSTRVPGAVAVDGIGDAASLILEALCARGHRMPPRRFQRFRRARIPGAKRRRGPTAQGPRPARTGHELRGRDPARAPRRRRGRRPDPKRRRGP